MTTPKSRAPTNAVPISSYSELDIYIRAFAGGRVGFVILVSNPGLGKTRAVRQALDEHVCWIDGNATAFGIYCHLFEQRNKIVVTDLFRELRRTALEGQRSAERAVASRYYSEPEPYLTPDRFAVQPGTISVPRYMIPGDQLCDPQSSLPPSQVPDTYLIAP